MPKLTPKKPVTPAYRLTLGAAVGRDSSDFTALGYCPELDEDEKNRDPAHEEVTFVVRYHGGTRDIVARHPERLDGLWRCPSGAIYAVGAPRGLIEITATSCTETPLRGIPGSGMSVWSNGPDHVFVCGAFAPFLLYRKRGVWSEIPLPSGRLQLRDLYGFAEDDLYVVGDDGLILHFDGRALAMVPCPTTRQLNAVRPLGSKLLCIGGYDGVLLCGDKRGWRLVPTHSGEPILNLAEQGGEVWFATPDGLFSFDGKTAPRLATAHGGRWVNGLGDAVMLVDEDDAYLYAGGTMTKLDLDI